MHKNQLILASSSPRRQALLEQVNIPFSIRKPTIDETTLSTTDDPQEKVKQLAILKGEHTPMTQDNEVILSADTIVSYRGSIFGKPQSKKDAFEMLTTLSGKRHDVYTGVSIRTNKQQLSFVEQTEVEFYPLTDEEITWYVATTDPYDKAGAYGIQNLGAIFVKQIIGDYYNVVGLPISRVAQELKQFSVYPT
ncbi:MAG TPA: Maf family protein [Pseudogracilibacillus sp.]|nr:Maf family protein [Pseudogracilibacillus sp.]